MKKMKKLINQNNVSLKFLFFFTSGGIKKWRKFSQKKKQTKQTVRTVEAVRALFRSNGPLLAEETRLTGSRADVFSGLLHTHTVVGRFSSLLAWTRGYFMTGLVVTYNGDYMTSNKNSEKLDFSSMWLTNTRQNTGSDWSNYGINLHIF